MDAVDGVESRAGGATNEREAGGAINQREAGGATNERETGGTTNKRETRRGRARVGETNERGEKKTKERLRLSSSLNNFIILIIL